MEDLLNNPGGRLLGRGYAGMWADTNPHASISMTNEGAPVVDFGFAVARGADATKCKRVTINGDVITGIAVRNAAIAPYNQTTGEVSYEQYKVVAVGKMGRMFVTALENAAWGDAVIAVVASGGALGSTTGGAAGAGRIAVTGAKWAEAVTAGSVGIIEFNLLGA